MWSQAGPSDRDPERASRAWIRVFELGGDATRELATLLREDPGARPSVLAALEKAGEGGCAGAARFLARWYAGDEHLLGRAPAPDPERGQAWAARADALERR